MILDTREVCMFGGLFRHDTRREIDRGIKKLMVRITHIKELVIQDGFLSHLPSSDPLQQAFEDIRRAGS